MQADVAEGLVRRGAQVDGGGAATCCRRPARPEELLAGGDQVVGPAAGPLGVEHQHIGVGRHQVDQQLHLVDQHGRERLHALDRDARGDLVGELEELGVLRAELGRPPAYLVGEQELATRRRPQALDLVEGPLVGHRERADLLHVVAPQLDPHRVLLGRREDVDDAAAHRELAALLHQVDPRVRRIRQPAYDVFERSGVTRRELDRFEVAESLHLRLQHRPHRRDHDRQRTVARVGAGVPQPAQDGQPLADRVAARAEPLVRQRLPARVVADLRRVDQVAQGRDQVLGLARGCGDRQDGSAGPHQARDQERPQRLRSGEVEGAHRPAPRIRDSGGERGVGEDGVGEAGE